MTTTKENNDRKATPWYKSPVLPWFLVTILVSVAFGVIYGWFLRSNVAYEKDQAVAAVVSKTQGR